MITVDEKLREGDLAYCWFSTYNEKKKPSEHEFRILKNTNDILKVHSIDGEYDLVFNKELIASMFGNCRHI